jgi:hypothetical protein
MTGVVQPDSCTYNKPLCSADHQIGMNDRDSQTRAAPMMNSMIATAFGAGIYFLPDASMTAPPTSTSPPTMGAYGT